MSLLRAKEHAWKTADGKRLVKTGHPDARFLFAATDTIIDAEAVKQFSAKDVKVFFANDVEEHREHVKAAEAEREKKVLAKWRSGKGSINLSRPVVLPDGREAKNRKTK